MVDEFDGGSWLYLCMRYMDKFHLEPKSWLDLFDFLTYTNTEAEMDEYIKLMTRKEK